MRKISVARQRAFLAAFAETASITKAAKAAKVDRSSHYDWLDNDPEYPKLFERAKVQAGDLLEAEAVRRAYDGVPEPIIYKGQLRYKTRWVTYFRLPDGREVRADKLPQPIADLNIVSSRTVEEPYGAPLTVQKHADGLLMFLLRGYNPKKYRENYVPGTEGNEAPPPFVVTIQPRNA